MAMPFEVCPECGKKGWYVTPSQWNLTNWRLHECRYCRANESMDFESKPPSRVIKIEPVGDVVALYLAGRCANGSELDCGTIWHAVPKSSNKALCGATHGRRSAGWRGDDESHLVTCPRCLKRMEVK